MNNDHSISARSASPEQKRVHRLLLERFSARNISLEERNVAREFHAPIKRCAGFDDVTLQLTIRHPNDPKDVPNDIGIMIGFFNEDTGTMVWLSAAYNEERSSWYCYTENNFDECLAPGVVPVFVNYILAVDEKTMDETTWFSLVDQILDFYAGLPSHNPKTH